MTPAKRHVPLRTCVACGSKGPKQAFTRIVATPEIGVKVDWNGRLSGRGAYICSGGECSTAALPQGRIERALKRSITEEDWMALTAEVAAGQHRRS